MIETVLAGSGDFVAAVAPALRSRSGAEPRLADDPRQAFTYCADTGGLLVIQYRGQEWLSVIRDLRSLCGDSISVVVAIAPDRLDDLANLQRAGADEVIPWDGRPDAVHWAVERILATRRARLAAPPPPGYLAPPSAPPPQLLRTTPAGGIPAVPQPGAPEAEPAATPLPAAAASAPAAAPWPAGVPAGPEAEWLLLAALTGAESTPGPQRQVADEIAQALTELERTAFQGTPVLVDAALVRGASVLRLRVALALASVPPPGQPFDAEAVQTLLAQLDEALVRLKGAGEGAEPQAQPGLEALRTALVHEAIDLTEAVQRLAPEGAAPAAPGLRMAAAQPATRLLSNTVEAARRPAPVGLLILLAIAVAAGGGFHLYRYLNRPVPPSFQYRGAPQGSLSSSAGQGKPTVIIKESGAFDPAEVEKLRAQEELKGNSVQQLAPGALLIVPGKPAAAAAPAQHASPPGGTP